MKIFQTSKGKIIQLADKKKIENWDAEMPLLFIGFIRDNILKTYDKSVQKDVDEYLDDILENIAIPKLLNALKSINQDERLKVAQNLVDISEKSPDQLKIALPHIEEAIKDSNKKVSELLNKSIKNYNLAQKKKQTAKKRKVLTALRKEMDRVELDYLDQKISQAEYMKKQDEYLKLKREIQLAEQVD